MDGLCSEPHWNRPVSRAAGDILLDGDDLDLLCSGLTVAELLG